MQWLTGRMAGTASPLLPVRLSRMVAAQSGVNCRLKELRIPFDPNVVTGLFDAITAAAGWFVRMRGLVDPLPW
jgi:hypothetical protein